MERESCPLCGALPCDWTDDPHKYELGLCWTLAKIREALGVNEKPMMDELPGIVAANMSRIEAQSAEIARLTDDLEAITNARNDAITLGAHLEAENMWLAKGLEVAKTFIGSLKHTKAGEHAYAKIRAALEQSA